MNVHDMFDIIGETPELYVKDAVQGATNAKQRSRRQISKIVLIAALISLLSATIATAADILIRVKYHDSFTGTTTEPPATGAPSFDPGKNDISDVDMSKNGVIEFRIDIDEEIYGERMPSLEVNPHFLTEEDIKRVAFILFPNGEFYEGESPFEMNFSKDEIQEKIDRWSYYTSEDALRELIEYRSNQPDYLQGISVNVQNFVDKYSGMLASASSENPHQLCDWTFKKSSYYSLTKEEFATKDTSNDNDNIEADIKVGDVRYHFSASIRDGDDFLISNIGVYPYDGIGPDMLDEHIFRTWLCRTEAPTDEQIAHVRTKAETMLAQMQLGQWLVDECYVETEKINEYTYYSIHVNAVPVLNGIPALRKAQLQNLRSDLPGAARLYYTDVQFEFSANGDLVYFSMKSPLEVKDVVAAEMSALDIEQQFRIAEEYLSRKSFYAYSMGMEVTFGHQGDPIGCIANITGLEYNLTRINGEDPLESYYYVPGIKLTGSVKYYNLETGEVYLERQDVVFAIIDASEGTVVLTP
jgi:hypothetical protein